MGMKATRGIILTFILLILTTGIVYAEKISFTIAENGVATILYIEPIKISLNGEELKNIPTPPVIYKNLTLVPSREIFEKLGAIVDWNSYTREVYIAYGDTTIILETDNEYAKVNGELIKMDIPAKNVNGKTMVPARFVSQELNFQISFEDATRTVFINAPKVEDEPLVMPGTETPAQPEVPTQPEVPIQPEIPTQPEIPIVQEVPAQVELPVVTAPISVATDISSKEITKMDYPETQIVSIDIPTINDAQSFRINANSEISEVKKLVLNDNRLIIDIVNAKMDVKKSVYELEDNSNCSAIRTGQFQEVPVRIARVVFDLTSSLNYSISLSSDRKTIFVEFEKNQINHVSFNKDLTQDYIVIGAVMQPEVSVSFLENPNRLVIDIPNSVMGVNVNNMVNGTYVKTLRTGQFETNVSRVVAEISGTPDYYVTVENGKTIVALSKQTDKSVYYDIGRNRIVIKKQNGITAASLIKNDDYLNYKYTITLPANYGGNKNFQYPVNTSSIKSVMIESNKITVEERKVLAPKITEDLDHIYIEMVNPKEVYSKVVVIDAGHGDKDPGTSGFGLIEKDLNLDIVKKFKILSDTNKDIKFYFTRLEDTYPTLTERVLFANETGDLFVSVHNNFIEQKFEINGTEIFYKAHSNDGTIGLTSSKAADIVHTRLLSALGSADRKVKTADYQVLTQTQIPAILCEVGFLSNEAEAAKLATDSYRQKAAEGIYSGIIDIFKVYVPNR